MNGRIDNVKSLKEELIDLTQKYESLESELMLIQNEREEYKQEVR